MQRLSAKDTSRLGQPDLGRECLLKNYLNSSDWSALAQDTRVAGSVPDLGQDCLQRLSVRRNASRERVNTIFGK